MILLLTRSDDVAADVLVLELERLEFPFVRVNTDRVAEHYRLSWTLHDAAARHGIGTSRPDRGRDERLVPKELRQRTAGRRRRISEQFVERESLAALSGLIETAPVRYWMSRPSAIRRAEHKLLQLRIAAEVGFAVPETLVSNDPGAVRAFTRDRDLIVKVVRSVRTSTASGDRWRTRRRSTRTRCRRTGRSRHARPSIKRACARSTRCASPSSAKRCSGRAYARARRTSIGAPCRRRTSRTRTAPCRPTSPDDALRCCAGSTCATGRLISPSRRRTNRTSSKSIPADNGRGSNAQRASR